MILIKLNDEASPNEIFHFINPRDISCITIDEEYEDGPRVKIRFNNDEADVDIPPDELFSLLKESQATDDTNKLIIMEQSKTKP